jgi:hypothetical protein
MSPAIRGVIERRILVNYRVDVGTLDAVLPDTFEGREVGESGKGIGSICLMRVGDARMRFAPEAFGVSVEAATHRISAVREKNGGTENCVYVPQRVVSSRLSASLGEVFLPAELGCGDFRVEERNGVCRIRVDCGDEFAGVEVEEKDGGGIEEGSVFGSIGSAAGFFCEAGMRYSPSGDRYEGVELCPREWGMEPVEVNGSRSSFFERLDGAELDSAFRMEGIEHEWRPRRPIPSNTTG